jgi:MoaA/NifB/PqqE/SkfB family radical SAM enzyme
MEKEVIERLIKWSKGKKAPPHKVLIYPTNKCNLKCPFCFLRLNPYDVSKDMPKEKWLEVTKELCEMGVNVLQISGGGEPLMVPETTLAMMKIIKNYGITGRLVNNGTLWKEEYIKEVIEIGWDHVIFSVDGPDAKTQDKSRGVNGVFEKNIKAILTFKKYKRLLASEKPVLEFSTVLTNINYKRLGGIIKLASRLNVENITFEPVFVTNPNVIKLKLNERQREWLMKEIPRLKKLANSLNISTNLDSLLKIKEIEKTGELKEKIIKEIKIEKNKFLSLPCYEPWLWPKIEADGRVGPCSSIFLSNFYGKEINVKNKSFKEMWYGWEFENFRKMIIEGRLLDACSNCVSTHIPTNKAIREELRKVLS